MLSISGFADDASCVLLSGESLTAETGASILTKFCSTTNISKYTPWVAHQGRSLLSMIALFTI